MVMKRLLPAIVATFLFLTGCQWGNNDTNRNEGRAPVDETRSTRDGRTMNNDFQNVENRNRFVNDNDNRTGTNNNRFEVSDEAAKRIVSEIDEIHQAYVITTKNNAYVAATLSEDNRNNTQRNRTNEGRNRTGNKNTNLNDRNDRTTGDRGAVRGNTDRKTDRNMTDRNTTDGRDSVTNVRDQGFDDDRLTNEVKDRVAKIVKDVDNNIDNVYVTTSPDFYNLTNDYVNDFQNGRPVEGFFDQIGNMIERVFPQNRR